MIDIDNDTITFTPEETTEQVEAKIEATWEIKFADLRKTLEACTVEVSAKLAEDMITVAPYQDYGKLLEEQEAIYTFLRDEGSLAKNWKLAMVEQTDTRLVAEPLLQLVFDNIAVDEPGTLKGFIYLSMSGKVKHAFVRNDQ